MSSDLLQQHQLIEQKFQQLTQKATQVEAFIKQQSTASSSSSFDVSQLIPRLQQIRILVQQQAQEIQQTLADNATLTTENQYLEKQIESLLQTLNQVEQSSSSSSTIMSENKPVTTPNVDKEQAKKDKKAAKDAKKAEKDAKKSAAQQAATRTAPTVTDPINSEFGDLALVQSQYKTERKWYNIGDIDEKLVSQNVWIRARAHNIRAKGNAVFIVLRRGFSTIQCAAFARDGGVSKDLVKFASKISSESIVDVQGEVTKVETPTKATQSTVEIQIKKLFVVSLAAPLPFQIEDAARPEPTAEEAAAEKIAAEKKAAAEAEAAKNKGKKQEKKDEKEEDVIIRVSQDTRLDNRWIDLRTPANHAIFRLQSRVCQYFRNFLIDRDFVEIHTPKITPGVSEGGAEVFRLDYFGQPACLAQSPQLYKQMGVTSDLFRVFEIGPVFRAENSNTHRHMCEFVGMDFEMEIKEHYHEVTKILGDVMVAIFDGINKNHKAELAAVGAQYPFEPLQYLPETLIFSHREAVELLRGDGINIGYDDDFSTAQEKHLGKLVKAKWKTDFYIVDQYPITARPFYTMPNPTNPKYTNSYDVFIRGEEITSGAQRIHEVELLQKRASECGIPASNIAKYLESFRYGAVPHGGAGVGLERVVMLFLGLDNIRKTSMFPRTPTRHEP